VKPSNVMVIPAAGADSARVKLLDLGVARPLLPTSHPADAGLTEAGVFLGTPGYVAPEQAEDPRRADARSDLYGLGATLYFLLSGAAPFPGQTPLEAVRRAATDPRPSLRARRPDVPPGLDAVDSSPPTRPGGSRPPPRWPTSSAGCCAGSRCRRSYPTRPPSFAPREPPAWP
jgi:serine/threonine-protein kinase